MPKYLISTIEQIEREYVVEAVSQEDAFEAMTSPRFIRVLAPPYDTTKKKRVDIKSKKIREREKKEVQRPVDD